MKTIVTLFLLIAAATSHAQEPDSIYFNLYTDSLKKGALHFNYINVDGLLKDGRYIPLDTTQVRFTVSKGIMKGNILQLDSSIRDSFIIITATLLSNPAITRSIRIPVKQHYPAEELKSEAELINGWQNKKKNH